VLGLFRLAAGFSVMLLAILSLLPGDEMVRTGLPSRLEHVAAYAGSAAITMLGYGDRHGSTRIVGFFWAYAGILEYLQHFSPGRHPSIWDFAASAFGALCGGLGATATPLAARSSAPAGYWRRRRG
jgi:VanZ family protein